MSQELVKKRRERHLIDAFLQLSGVNGHVDDEGESPDFKLSVDGRLVGVELTEVYVPDDSEPLPPKARESLADKIVNAARILYEQTGGPPLHVAIGFSPRTDFAKLPRADTATTVANFLLRQSFRPGSVSSWKGEYRGELPTEIHFLNAFPVSDSSAAHWYAPKAGWVVPLTAEILQKSIDEKAKKLTSYRSAAEEIWLILAITGGAPSQGFDFRHQIDWHGVGSPFDRTYLLSLINGTVTELGQTHDA